MFAVLYAFTLPAGTYIGQLLVSLKALLLANVGGVVARHVNEMSDVHLVKAYDLIDVTLLGIVSVVNNPQLPKA